MIAQNEFCISPETLDCASALPSKRNVSSRNVGWSSLLIDHHIGTRNTEPYRPIPTPDVEIGVAISGRYASEVLRRGKWRRGFYGPGAICMPRNGETQSIRFLPFEDVESSTAMLYLPHGQLRAAIEHLRRPGVPTPDIRFEPPVDRDPAIFQMSVSLLSAMDRGADDLYAQTAGAWLAVHLATHHLSAPIHRKQSVDVDISDARLASVVEYVSVHYAEPLSLEDLAAEACVSKFHFARTFRRKTGQTPHDYLTKVRLEAACRLLLTSDLPLAEVGRACGYPVATHFSTAFKKRYGDTPKAFRARRDAR